MTRNLSIFDQLRPVTVGFDNIFDHFERMFDGDVMNIPQVNYPPYNIVKTGELTYDIELALAGFSKNDIDVEYSDFDIGFINNELKLIRVPMLQIVLGSALVCCES